MTTTESHSGDEAGRQVRLVPLAPGSWWVLFGAGAMTLGPLFGFLAGTMAGTNHETFGMAPIFFFLFLGFIVAGLGLGVVLLGIRRIVAHRGRTSS